MPKIAIDYANTIIYKIVCNDLTITDCYVGHTTNFVQRRREHKSSCMNEKGRQYNWKLYIAIRANGGWLNYSMVEIEKFKCADVNEACAKEREHYEKLNSILNSHCPHGSSIVSATNKLLYQKIYKDHINVNKKVHREINVEQIKANRKIYRESNKDKIHAYDIEYNENNKDRIRGKQSQKYVCECGSELSAGHKARHKKSKFHIDFLASSHLLIT